MRVNVLLEEYEYYTNVESYPGFAWINQIML